MSSIVRMITLGCLLLYCGCGGGGGDSGGGACADLNLRIYGGETCGSAPGPVVRLEVLLEDGSVARCSGALVSNNDILTAGHCLDGALAVTAFIGSNGYAVIRAALHPAYHKEFIADLGWEAPRMDAAMLTIEQPVPIGPVPLLLSDPVAGGQQFDIFGFGDVGDGSVSDEVKAGYSMVVSTLEEMIIAESVDSGADTCWGDSGGPAARVLNGVTGLIGITSWGTPECTAEGISVYTNIQHPAIRDFILGYAAAAPRI